MMKQLRSRKLMRRILQVTLILTIPSFIVFYGWGGGSKKQAMDANSTVFASIKSTSGFGRTELTTADWVQAKNQLVNNVASLVGKNYNANQIETAIPRKRIAEEAVNLYALGQVARDTGFEVTQGELSQLVTQSYPGMTVDQIRTMVERNGRNFRGWIQDMQRSLGLGKAQMYIESAAHITLPELWRQYEARETTVGLEYAEISVVDKENEINVSDAELEKEYEARKEELKVPDQAIYEYVSVDRAAVRSGIQMTEAEARAFYDANKEEKFSAPGQATLRHVLIVLAPGADEEEIQSAKGRIDQVYQKAKSGAPLAQLADEYSEDPENTRPASEGSTETVKMGGLLLTPVTTKQQNQWGEDFIKTVFSIPEDSLSTPVLTKRGWDVFQIVSRTAPKVRPFDEVRVGAENTLREEKLTEAMNEQRQEFETARKNQTTLEGIAKALHTDVRETSPVLLGSDNIPPVGYVRDYLSDIADLQPGGEPTYVIESSNGYDVLQMKELIPSHIPTLAEVREKLTADIKSKMALDAAIAEAKSLAAKVEAGDNFTSLALELKISHNKTPEPFALSSASYPFSQMQDLSAWVLRTPVGKTFLTEGFKFGDVPRSLFVCKIEEKTAPERSKFLADLTQMELQGLYQNRQVLLNGYLQDARKQLSPEYNQDIVSAK